CANKNPVSHHMKLRHIHYWISLALALALPPAMWHLHLPFRFDWITLTIAYWFVLAAQAIFVAAILCVLGMPGLFASLLSRYRRSPVQMLLLFLFFIILAVAFSWPKALVLTIDAAAILELRAHWGTAKLRSAAAAVPLPALYLFAGFFVMLGYNVVIV